MKKFLAIYMAPIAELDKMMQNTSKEQMKEMDATWLKWIDDHKDSFVDVGAALGKNKRVTKDGVSDVRNELTGYSIVQAESHEDACKIFEDNPMFEMPGAYVEVLVWVEMPTTK
ncbi:MAG: hypothetical protein PHS79_05720 [Patescibacteria group bacterium]|nr:hypothetical protein [Patescibacteria group bacterium]